MGIGADAVPGRVFCVKVTCEQSGLSAADYGGYVGIVKRFVGREVSRHDFYYAKGGFNFDGNCL